MPVLSFRDLREYRRCPYAFRLSVVSDDWRLSPQECMDAAVHRALSHVNGRRVRGQWVTKDEMLAIYREEWDRCIEDACAGEGQDMAAFFRDGEDCVRRLADFIRVSDGSDIVAFDIRGVQSLPFGTSVRVGIDEVYRRGGSTVLCRYVTEPDEGPRKELSEDLEARVSALWATYSLPGADRMVLQWRFLRSGDETECAVRKPAMDEAAKKLSQELVEVSQDRDFVPSLGDSCRLCPHRSRCDAYLSTLEKGDALTKDQVDALVREYAELDEKVAALKLRLEMLESRRDSVKARIVSYADSARCDRVDGERATLDIRRYRRANLPKDKSAVIKRLRETGQYDRLSMVNYSRLRSDIVKGVADPEIAKMAVIAEDVRVRVLKKQRRPQTPRWYSPLVVAPPHISTSFSLPCLEGSKHISPTAFASAGGLFLRSIPAEETPMRFRSSRLSTRYRSTELRTWEYPRLSLYTGNPAPVSSLSVQLSMPGSRVTMSSALPNAMTSVLPG